MDNNYLDIKLCLDMLSSKTQASIPMRKGDTNVRFLISFSNNSEAYRIPDGVWAILSVKPESDLEINPYSCTIIDESTVVFIPDDVFAQAEGFNEVEVTLYDGKNGGRALTSPRFSVYIDDKINVGNIPVFKGDEIETFGEIFANEETRESNETKRETAEKLRDEAENGTEDTIGRVQAEAARESAENERVQAENARVSAENERAEAENLRNAAEAARTTYFDKQKDKLVAVAVDTAKPAIKEAAEEVRAYTETALRDTDKRITNLEKRINPTFFVTDDDVAHTKIAPARACPYAQLNYIGGKTREVYGDNLLRETTKTADSNGNVIAVAISTLTLDSGTYVFTSNNDKLNIRITSLNIIAISGKFTLSTKSEIAVECESNEPFSANEEITFTPELKKFEGLAPTKTTAVKVHGNNLMPFPYTSHQSSYSVMEEGFTYDVSSGFTVKVKPDKTFAFSMREGFNVTTGAPTIYLMKEFVSFDRDVFVSTSPTGGGTLGYSVVKNGAGNNIVTDYGTESRHGGIVEAGTKFKIVLAINANVDVSQLTFKPMITYADVEVPYSPPNEEPVIHNVPDTITSIEGYGEANPADPSEYNYIDLDAQSFIAKGKLVNDSWERFDAPVTTPIVFDKFIEVKGGSPIEFVNEAKLPIPSSISYMLKEGT